MKLSEFVTVHLQDILAEWDKYAATMTPAADAMTLEELRDHAEQMVWRIAERIDTPANASAGIGELEKYEDANAASAAGKHGALRQEHKFSLVQLSSEFRALRASILKLWLPHVIHSEDTVASVVRFNAAVDEALADSIVTFTKSAEAEHDLFIAVLGHDLRAPLATINMAGSLLREPGVTTERQAALGGSVTTAASQMTSMVNDLLGLASSKLGGGIPIVREPVDVRNICAAAMADAAALFPESDFVHPHGPALPGRFDPVRLQQLVTNLLINAAQHGVREHPVRMEAEENGTTLTIRVHNFGTPIPVDCLERIFDPMHRLGDVSEHVTKVGGRSSLGLGLYIAREIAHGHDGSIHASSNERDGTTFVVALPNVAADAAARNGDRACSMLEG